MALTFTFIGATPNRAVYKIETTSGGTATLTNQGAATPDLSTDIKANTPLGAFLRTAVATNAAAENLLQYTTAAQVTAQVSTATSNTVSGVVTVQGRRNGTSGLADILANCPTNGDVNAVLIIELYHTIDK